ncbi:MAG: asparagine synthase (glutamine-hydrolyzing) [Bacteroidales bacterium]|nr:asparagine synthase (glutamine-hydrolyzing) [Bacteroidales bacterium]MCF8454714.1 asparagine synthase (glutamine-hydrolyzing) [Bacteroidales bacterium]
MCGFVGIVNKGNVNPEYELLKKMAETIAHRGPDAEGHFIEKGIGFYHKRLSIIDLKTGQQPMSTENLTITFNGEIYNYVELREELIAKGYHFRTRSDTEVILRMYEEYGTEFVHKLNGMFAFLIYDKIRNKILAARDHFGIKPLYFYKDNDCFLFASEIKALLVHPKVKAEANFDNLYEYLTFQFIIGQNTLFQNIYKLNPGHYLCIDLNSFNSREVKYWEPNFSIDKFHTSEYFEFELQKLLRDTIKMQMRSDVPVGTYLSGGFDSSLVTMLSAGLVDHPISTFSGAFKEGPEFDETEYSREVVKMAKAKAFEIFPTSKDFVENMPKLIYHLDEPVAGPGVFPQYMVSKLAAENVTVVLGGQGGDEIFGGYARYMVTYLEQAIKGSIMETTDEGEHIVSLKSILPNLPSLKEYIPMLKSFMGNNSFGPMDRRYFDIIDRMHGNSNYFTPGFAASYDSDKVFKKFSSSFNNPNTQSFYNKMTHFDMFGSLPALLQVEDRVSMAASIESRVPLLDKRIVDLVASMPPAMKFKGGELKYFLKKSVGHLLPEKILNRKDKMGFPVPLHLWAKNGAQEFISDILLSKKCCDRGIFNCDKVAQIIKSEQPFGRQIWGMLSLELWFNTFIDK